VPTQPPIDGLPLWAQLAISFLIGLATLGVAFKGYLVKDKPTLSPSEPQSAAIMAATIADMGAIRNLSDCVVRLDASIVAMTRQIEEEIHYRRTAIELDREVCARLRELREVLEQREGRG
jgi:hypothetical protein